MSKGQIEQLTIKLLSALGEDPAREGLNKTPARVAEAWDFLTEGYRQEPESIIREAIFESDADEMVFIRDIDFYSLCEHHLLPFYGKAHVAYIPKGQIVGLSKIPRVVDAVSRKLQVQERMTMEIADAIQTALDPLGVAVVVEGYHTCMAMRGVRKQNSSITTSAMRGAFRSRDATRREFLSLLQNRPA